jgi:hypothetical protein
MKHSVSEGARGSAIRSNVNRGARSGIARELRLEKESSR